MRAEGGKTYGISSQWKGFRDFGVVGVMTSTRVEEVRNTYDLIFNEMQKLVDEFKAILRWKTNVTHAMWIAYSTLFGIIIKLIFF